MWNILQQASSDWFHSAGESSNKRESTRDAADPESTSDSFLSTSTFWIEDRSGFYCGGRNRKIFRFVRNLRERPGSNFPCSFIIFYCKLSEIKIAALYLNATARHYWSFHHCRLENKVKRNLEKVRAKYYEPTPVTGNRVVGQCSVSHAASLTSVDAVEEKKKCVIEGLQCCMHCCLCWEEKAAKGRKISIVEYISRQRRQRRSNCGLLRAAEERRWVVRFSFSHKPRDCLDTSIYRVFRHFRFLPFFLSFVAMSTTLFCFTPLYLSFSLEQSLGARARSPYPSSYRASLARGTIGGRDSRDTRQLAHGVRRRHRAPPRYTFFSTH